MKEKNYTQNIVTFNSVVLSLSQLKEKKMKHFFKYLTNFARLELRLR